MHKANLHIITTAWSISSYTNRLWFFIDFEMGSSLIRCPDSIDDFRGKILIIPFCLFQLETCAWVLYSPHPCAVQKHSNQSIFNMIIFWSCQQNSLLSTQNNMQLQTWHRKWEHGTGGQGWPLKIGFEDYSIQSLAWHMLTLPAIRIPIVIKWMFLRNP